MSGPASLSYLEAISIGTSLQQKRVRLDSFSPRCMRLAAVPSVRPSVRPSGDKLLIKQVVAVVGLGRRSRFSSSGLASGFWS